MKLKSPILITGHTGFKGAWLGSLLNELGIPFIGFSLAPDKESLAIEFTENYSDYEKIADIRNYRILKKFINKHSPEAVIHLAAQPLVLDSYTQPLETFEVNTMGTANLLDICQNNKNVKAVLVITTDKVYQNSEKSITFKESDALKGKDPYSSSKVAAEAVVDGWISVSENFNGPRIATARAGNVIGGGDLSSRRLIPDLIKGIKSNSKVKIRNPESTRPWQHVLDPIFGYLMYLDYMLENSRYEFTLNFGPKEESLPVFDVANKFMSKFNANELIEIDSNGNYLLEAKHLNLDSKLATTEIDWTPTWTQNEAINFTADWWLNSNMGNNSKEVTKHQIEQFLRAVER